MFPFGWFNIIFGASIFVALILQLTSCSSVDPDRTRLIPEFITSRGFIHQPHYLTTSDGYILGIHRIVNPFTRRYIARPKPVLLQCGLLCSGSEFLDNFPGGQINETMLAYRKQLESIDFDQHRSLGFLLANLGYDVWLFHPRGNFYSRNHTKLNPDSDPSFWEFTFDEISLKDLPTTIDFIIKVTRQSSVGYIGYSQGGTTIFALLSDKPEYGAKVVPVINIAPAVRLDNYAGLSYQAILENPYVRNFIKSRGGECFGFMTESFMSKCDENFFLKMICNFITYDLLAINKAQVDPNQVTVFLSHMPAGTSCWNILHFLQLMINKEFAKFDLGEKGNMEKYNSTEPPAYNLSAVQSNDMYFVVSEGDHSADPGDIALLKTLLTSVPTITQHTIEDTTFDHLDYIMSKHIGTYVNGPIAEMLTKYSF